MFGNPAQGPRLVPFAGTRTTSDRIPNGHPSFRVTQRYGDLDAYFKDRPHGAMDIGNGYCGDPILAMEAGTAYHLEDPNGALGVEVRHANGYKTQYWHLSKRNVAHGAKVARGAIIGYVGSTGLDIGGCHCHVVVLTPAGARVDPWPLLDQNATVRYVRVPAGVNIRKAARMGQVYVYTTSTATTAKINLRFGGFVKGERHGIAPYPDEWAKVWYNRAYRFVARPFVRFV